MRICDQRGPITCKFSELNRGELFAWEEGDLFYLMVIDDDDGDVAEDCGKAVVLGADCDSHCEGLIWAFKFDEEVQPLKGDLKVWAK